jgi:hypothetical protein
MYPIIPDDLEDHDERERNLVECIAQEVEARGKEHAMYGLLVHACTLFWELQNNEKDWEVPKDWEEWFHKELEKAMFVGMCNARE